MINFGDLNPITQVNVTEPIAKAQLEASKMMVQGIKELEANISAENAAYREVFNQIMQSGKVDFMGGSATAYKGKYKQLKDQLLNDMKQYSSVQSFLNNGGYEKIANFKDELEGSQEFKNGVQSSINAKIVQNHLANGKSISDLKFGEGGDYNSWLRGDASKLDLIGTYNTSDVKFDSFVLKDKGEQDVSFDTQTLRKTLESNDFSPQKTEQIIQLHEQDIAKGGKGFLKQSKDENYEIRKAQQKNITLTNQELIDAKKAKRAADAAAAADKKAKANEQAKALAEEQTGFLSYFTPGTTKEISAFEPNYEPKHLLEREKGKNPRIAVGSYVMLDGDEAGQELVIGEDEQLSYTPLGLGQIKTGNDGRIMFVQKVKNKNKNKVITLQISDWMDPKNNYKTVRTRMGSEKPLAPMSGQGVAPSSSGLPPVDGGW